MGETNQADRQALIQSLETNLLEYGYTEAPVALDIDGVHAKVLATPRRQLVRYTCCVLDLPHKYVNPTQAQELFRNVRRRLTKEYARFPFYKEVCTYMVWICSEDLYKCARDRELRLYDRTGLHMTVMLGTVVVNRKTSDKVAQSTWGLYFSGKHFGAITATVNDWCKSWGPA
jgi:hypothetical protein